MRFLIAGVLLLFLNASCASGEIAVKITRDDIQGSINNHIEVTAFDGAGLKAIPVSDNKFTCAHGITSNYYGVLFLTKQGHYPETIIFKAQDNPVTIDYISLSPVKDPQKGILTGVVYKPVTGGKLREHKGISRMFKSEKIILIKGNVSHETATNDRGVFLIELLPGNYNVVLNNKNAGSVLIERGATAIHNIQKGTMIID